jgi:threonylcarbamoyladenosine tRNA methylthiotransferase MtaB
METNSIDLKNKRVALHTLGCRLNSAETGAIAQGFQDRGYDIVNFGENADVVFINTCTVTDAADSTCRNLIRKAHASSPEAKIVVAGCYAQMESERIAGMQGVDLVLGNTEKYKVFEYLNEEAANQVHVDNSWEFFSAATTQADSHTRAFLKIQDGCNYVCSFCIIPFARGRSRAISIADAVVEAKKLVQSGFREIVLTGVNIGEYEHTSGEKLHHLVAHLLAIDGLERFRMSSVEPNTFTDELIEVLKSSPKVQDHFHIPLQSGDDEILTAMRRKYTVSDYKKVINKLMQPFPNAGIGADVIVGFPGETKAQFENTYNLLKELPLTHFHVFPYSKRKNTTAAKIENHIHHDEKKNRVKTLLMFGEAKLSLFSEDQVGKTTKVLFEKRNKQGLFEGYSSNYVRVQVHSDLDLSNQICDVYLRGYENNKLMGELTQ